MSVLNMLMQHTYFGHKSPLLQAEHEQAGMHDYSSISIIRACIFMDAPTLEHTPTICQNLPIICNILFTYFEE
jgi:hypothetical protein